MAATKKTATKKAATSKAATKPAVARKSVAAKKATAKAASRTAGNTDDHSSHTTVDHDEIRQWVESHGGWPAAVRSTENKNDVGLLRIEFTEASSDSLDPIEWEEFFEKFDEKGLAFLYQPSSRFNKLISRENTKTAGSK